MMIFSKAAVKKACEDVINDIEKDRAEKVAKKLSKEFVRFDWKTFRFVTFKAETIEEYNKLTYHTDYFNPENEYRKQYEFAKTLKSMCEDAPAGTHDVHLTVSDYDHLRSYLNR